MRARTMMVATAISLFYAPSAFVQSFSVGSSPIAITTNGVRIRGDGSIDEESSARKRLTRSCSASMMCLRMSSTPFNYGQRQVARQNVRLPLLVDIAENGGDGRPRYDVPLPNGHLPPELTTASLYELKLDVPLHRTVIQDAVASAEASSGSSPFVEEGCCYGHVVYAPDDADDLVGSIGCASEILIGAPSATNAKGDLLASDKDDSGPLFVLARGSFRFQVKEIVKSIPYPIAIVDEILDDEVQDEIEGNDDDDEGDVYDALQSGELCKEIFQGLEKILKAQAEETATPLSPLEMDILQNAPSSAPMAQAIQRRFDAEERIAVFETFTSSLLDIAPDERDRMFAVAMMAGELASLPSELRAKMLVMTNGAARLRMVLRELSAVLSMDSARKITKSLSLGGEGGDIKTDARSLREAEDARKELRVGTPQLPPWADQIKKGTRVEYYWNEEEEWCLGTVAEDPVKIMEEIILEVKFDDDGSVHKLPFRGDEKARWRPPMGNSGAFD